MRFSSAKTLALSLLAGQLALAAPLQLDSDAGYSVHPGHETTDAQIETYDFSNRRRSSNGLVALAERLYSRGTGTNSKGTTSGSAGQGSQDQGSSRRPASPAGEKPPTKRPRPKEGPGGSGGAFGSTPDVEMPDVNSPEWIANKQLAGEKGQDIQRQLEEALAKRGADTGDMTPVVTEDSNFWAFPARLTDEYDEYDEMGYLAKHFDPEATREEGWDDWPTRSTYRAGEDPYFPALKIAASIEDHALSIQHSSKAAAGENPPSWTRMVYDSARTMLGEEGMSTLKWINRHNIVSFTQRDSNGILLDTPDAIQYAYKTLGGKRAEELTIDFNPAKNTPEADVVDYLSAQPHVARVMQLLKDYPASFGYKQISKIHLRDEWMQTGMLIELTD